MMVTCVHAAPERGFDMSAEKFGRRWAGEPTRQVADYYDKLLATLHSEAPLDHHEASMRTDELSCMRRALSAATAGRNYTAPARPPAAPPHASHAPAGACMAIVESILVSRGSHKHSPAVSMVPAHYSVHLN